MNLKNIIIISFILSGILYLLDFLNVIQLKLLWILMPAIATLSITFLIILLVIILSVIYNAISYTKNNKNTQK
jgi:uncharacterized membrane protein HdeD (DUF308 family)